jgi:hypothetical protein
MVAELNLYLAFGLIAMSNEPLELSMLNLASKQVIKHSYKFCRKCFMC